MNSMITTTLALFLFLLAGTTVAATTDTSVTGLQSIHSDLIFAKDKKKKLEEEPDCD